MAAVVEIIERTDASTTTVKSGGGTVRFKDANNATVDTNNPLVIPASGAIYSFDKWLRLNVTTAPDTQIDTVAVYSDGSNNFGTGVSCFIRAVTTFATPTKPTADTGTDLFTYTSGSALSLGAGPYTGTGEIADHAVLNMKVDSTASPGTLTAEPLTFSYNEI